MKKPKAKSSLCADLGENVLFALLKIQKEHDARINAIEQAVPLIELDPLRVDLLEIVFDALGVPREKPSDYEIFGSAREHFKNRWFEIEETADDAAIRDFLRWMPDSLRSHSESLERQ